MREWYCKANETPGKHEGGTMKHTKGAWEAIGSCIRDEEHIEICTCSTYQESANANARLIATAITACQAVNPDNPMAVADSIKEMYEFLLKVKAQPYVNQELMRQHGFVIDNLEDRWQKLVFTLHTNDAALSTEAEQILEELQEGPCER